MLSNRLAFVTLGIICVAAAAGGSYVATRHNALDQFTVPSTAASPTLLTPAGMDAAAPVAATLPAAAETPQPSPVAEAAPAPAPANLTTPAPPASPARATQPARTASVTKPASASRKTPEPRPGARAAQRSEPAPAASETTASASPTLPAAPTEQPAVAQRTEDRVADTQSTSTPPPATFDEVVVAADSVIGFRTDTALSSERARVEDRVEARVVRDVRVGNRVAIPAGTRALGSVVVVERGGKLKERARLGIRFHTLALADGTRLPISTETIYRYGDAPGDGSSKKIGGGAVAGAILGAIIGGGKGAAIGAATGAAGGGAVVMAGDRSEAVFASGAEVTARIVSPVTVTLER